MEKELNDKNVDYFMKLFRNYLNIKMLLFTVPFISFLFFLMHIFGIVLYVLSF